MQELLGHPAVQSALAPLLVGLGAAAVLVRLRLGGIAVVAGFATAVGLIAGFSFSPLTVIRKIMLVAMLATVAGIGIDFGTKPNPVRSLLLALAAGVVALWVFWPVLAQKDAASAWLGGVVAVGLVVWLVGYTDRALADRPVQAAVAALFMGLGAGALGLMGASASYAQYGIAIGAGAGGLLLLMMLLNRSLATGATLGLPAAMLSGLLVAAAMNLAQLQWYAALLFGLTPLAARLPVATRSPIWIRAIAQSLVAVVPAVLATLAAHYGSRGPAT